jgi:tRNA-2-methylthio-N6-dimethylallyladenosine synthase
VVTVTISEAKPYYLLADSADGAPLAIRRTRAGDAWDRAEAESCAVPSHGGASETKGAVSLGLPTLRIASPSLTGPNLATPSLSKLAIYDQHDEQR